MGLLETRLLDFENVVITNLNEGILPKAENSFSFFPFDVRKKVRNEYIPRKGPSLCISFF